MNYLVEAYCWKCDQEPILNVVYTWDSEKNLWHKGESADKFDCPECLKYTETHPNSPPAKIILMNQPEWLAEVPKEKSLGARFLKRLFRS